MARMLILLVASVLVSGCMSVSAMGPRLETGTPAPPFRLQDGRGEFHGLEQLLADGPVLVVFFGGRVYRPGHGPGRFGQVKWIRDEITKRGVRIVGISADPALSLDDIAAREKVDFLLLSDPWLQTVAAYGVEMQGERRAVPAVFLVRQDGSLAWSYIGERYTDRPDGDAVLAAIDRM